MEIADRAILHVDMDAFFASIEQLDMPELRGKPVLVGGAGPRGVVAAASYEAREFGCHSAQPMAIARRNCPQAIIRPVRGARYRELSQQIFAILHDITPLVEPLSVDEAFLDVTGSTRMFGPPEVIAKHIRTRVKSETGLTASVGVSFNKFLAKLASDWEKPDGLTVLTRDDLAGRIAQLPIRKMWGVGPASERKLHQYGLRTFGDLQRHDPDALARLIGSAGPHYHALATGRDERSVTPDHHAKSIGSEQTFGSNLARPEDVREVLLRQTEHVALRVRKAGRLSRGISLKIRFGDFETISRSAMLEHPTDRTDLLWQCASAIFERWARGSFRPVRLIGVSAAPLTDERGTQLDLFAQETDALQRGLDRATDTIIARYGKDSIHRGLSCTDASLS